MTLDQHEMCWHSNKEKGLFLYDKETSKTQKSILEKMYVHFINNFKEIIPLDPKLWILNGW